jgi:hypothetical protein
MIVAFSVESSRVDYGMFEISYFVANGAITWLALFLIIQTFQQDKSNFLEFVAYTALLYVVVYEFSYGSYAFKEPVEAQPENTTPGTEDSTANPAEQTPNPGEQLIPTLGSWEFAGIALMLSLRFTYSIYKLVNYYKSRKRSANDDSFSLINIG